MSATVFFGTTFSFLDSTGVFFGTTSSFLATEVVEVCTLGVFFGTTLGFLATAEVEVCFLGVFSAGTLPHMKVDNAVIVAVPDDYVEVELDDSQFALLYASGILKEIK